jgi:hypothetical protein
MPYQYILCISQAIHIMTSAHTAARSFSPNKHPVYSTVRTPTVKPQVFICCNYDEAARPNNCSSPKLSEQQQQYNTIQTLGFQTQILCTFRISPHVLPTLANSQAYYVIICKCLPFCRVQTESTERFWFAGVSTSLCLFVCSSPTDGLLISLLTGL